MERFAIHELSVGAGVLALCPLPGRDGHYEDDLAVLRNWQPDLVVSMTQVHEMAEVGALLLGDDLEKHGCGWLHLPVEDFGTLGPSDEAEWATVRRAALALLSAGNKVLVHCKGGCGRSGMVVLRLMIIADEAPDAALARLRQVRPCAVETLDQLKWAQS
ncbi:protein-tyrosine phosphatase family protein [Roseovarius sp. EL26]|uniref:phosphatase domain-containing putative toxin n=1 Tax=Roseovarius sp. EL26 TaxID=2126672 RepID=UPI000EA3988B|nr:protein-tyrosine phosphatase family protein [Roseovarius sp. EL26]